MENLPKPANRTRARVTDDAVKLVTDDVELDITEQVERVNWDLSAHGSFFTVTIRAEVELDVALDRVLSGATARDVLEHVTPDELDQVVAAGGYTTSPGRAIWEHLQRLRG